MICLPGGCGPACAGRASQGEPAQALGQRRRLDLKNGSIQQRIAD